MEEFVRGDGEGDRSQAAPLGLALVFAIVVMSISAVVVLSAGAITETQTQISVQNAEKTLTQLDAEMAKVALGSSDDQSMELGDPESSYKVDADAGWIKVERSGGPDPLPKQRLGEIFYQRGRTRVAYQGGGVWRNGPSGNAVMVSPPEFHFRDGTLTLPVIAVSSSDGTLGQRASLEKAGSAQKYPDASAGKLNPVPQGVTVVVKSEYYEAWGRYFEERTEGIVEYDHGANKVKLELVTPVGSTKMKNALAALSSNGDFKIRGAGAKPGKKPVSCSGLGSGFKLLADSYDSDSGDYCSSRQNGGANIIYGGSIDVGGAGNSNLYGTLKSDEIYCSNCNNLDVFGKVKYNTCTGTGNCDQLPAGSYSHYPSANIGSRAAIDGLIDRTYDDLEEDNDNGESGVPISGNTLDFSGGTAELGPGTYHLNRIDLGGSQTLKLDTAKDGGGSITIAVRDYVDVGHGTIKVEGTDPNTEVEIYVKGENTVSGTYHLKVRKSGRVKLPNDRSYRLQVLGKRDFKAQFKGKGGKKAAIFEGVVYAPIGSSGSGEVYLEKAQVFGGIITGDTEVNVQAAVHYDQALQSEQILNPNSKVAKITYLHISVNRVDVDG